MKRRYHALFAIALGLAALLTALGRGAKHAPPPPPASAPAPLVQIRIELRNGVVSPPLASIPKDHRVALEIANLGGHATSVHLAGYEDRVAVDGLAPGATRRIEFLVDRPGDDFPWLVDGRPSGRFVVAGSHLEDGRR